MDGSGPDARWSVCHPLSEELSFLDRDQVPPPPGGVHIPSVALQGLSLLAPARPRGIQLFPLSSSPTGTFWILSYVFTLVPAALSPPEHPSLPELPCADLVAPALSRALFRLVSRSQALPAPVITRGYSPLGCLPCGVVVCLALWRAQWLGCGHR